MGPTKAADTGAAGDTAHTPALAQVRRDLARLPGAQRKVMLREWEILQHASRHGCPTRAQVNKLTLRLDAAAAGQARAAVMVFGCGTARHGG